MGRGKIEKLEVEQGFDRDFLRRILTRDISPTEAIFDLVDNSIDAARNALYESKAELDKLGLPASYSGYVIALTIKEKQIAIVDNCYGFSRETLEKDAFVVGKPSHHEHGIGHFGVGMKRALLALGDSYHLNAHSDGFNSSMEFSSEDLSKSDHKLIASVSQRAGLNGTTIEISELRPAPANELVGKEKTRALRKQLSRRYGLFVRKGLKLTLNGKAVESFGPDIRRSGPISKKSTRRTVDGVTFYAEAGFHSKYRMTNEAGYDQRTNNSISDEFGWYYVCNDRIILVASTDPKLGFPGVWHPEYNGFVGLVHFVAKDPEDLPWDTKKTGIDPNAELFQKVRDKLISMVSDFRRENRKARKPKKKTNKKSNNPKKDTRSERQKRHDHVKDLRKLLPHIDLAWGDRKIESLLAEAEELSVTYPFACCAMLRMIVERLIVQHVKRSGKFEEVKQKVFDDQASTGRAFTVAQKEQFEPSLRNFVDWLKSNSNYFDSEYRKDASQSLNKFSTALRRTINGVMHQATVVAETQVVEIRNEAFPLIDYLCETAPKK